MSVLSAVRYRAQFKHVTTISANKIVSPLIHIDINYAELYTGLIDINLAETQHNSMEASHVQLQNLAEHAKYPITHTLVGSGDLSHEMCDTINNFNVDLVVCGHHQDFWSKLLSSARQLINASPVDMLVVPLRDFED